MNSSRLAIFGAAVLHAAALDPRIGRVVVENTLASYRSIVDVPVHRDMSEVVIPGVLRKYDVADLVRAIAPRRVTVVNPVDGAGSATGFPKSKGVTVLSRRSGEKLAID